MLPVLDDRGPNTDLHDRLEATTDRVSDPVIRFAPMTVGDYMAAGQAFVFCLQNGIVLHATDEELDESATIWTPQIC